MNSLKYLLSTVLVPVMLLVSCKKSFLDVPVTREVVAEDYVTNLSTSQEFLNGVYFTVARDVYSYETIAYADIVADNLKPLSTAASRLFAHYSWQQEADETAGNSTNLNKFWMNSYKTVRACNFLLERIDDYRNEDPVSTDAIKGQAYALRALMHFNLVNVFAQPYNFTAGASHEGIPYDTIYVQTEQITRVPVSMVYENIINDLKTSIQLIPTSLNSQSVLNKSAVKALLARVYLFKGDYSNAKTIAGEITISFPLLSASNYPTKLFTPNDNETLFWLPPVEIDPSQGSSTQFIGYHFSLNWFAATNDLVSIIQERANDQRKKWFTLTSGNWKINKFPQGAVAGVTSAPIAYYQPVVRSSEMFLTMAEACAQTSDEANARTYLDAVRQRADPSAIATTATGTALLDSIYKERRKELCFENARIYDLLRWKKSVKRTDIFSTVPQDLSYPNDKSVAPLPLDDIFKFKMDQNNGY
jgi:hypothetical protein